MAAAAGVDRRVLREGIVVELDVSLARNLLCVAIPNGVCINGAAVRARIVDESAVADFQRAALHSYASAVVIAKNAVGDNDFATLSGTNSFTQAERCETVGYERAFDINAPRAVLVAARADGISQGDVIQIQRPTGVGRKRLITVVECERVAVAVDRQRVGIAVGEFKIDRDVETCRDIDDVGFTFAVPVSEQAVSDAVESGFGGQGARPDESATILAIDDDPQLLRYVRNTLTEAGYTWMGTGNPDELVHFLEIKQPDLVLLDLILPRVSGFDVMKRIRQVSTVPVIFLSAHDSEEHVVQALRMGADDYIVKPFSPNELVARIEASLRKRAVFDHAEVRRPYRLGELTIDYMERGVTVSDAPVHLTATEYKLLFELSVNAGRVLTHDQILQRVWGPEYSGDAQLVRAMVKKVRRKLGEDGSNPKYVLTEPRVGYMMAKPQGV